MSNQWLRGFSVQTNKIRACHLTWEDKDQQHCLILANNWHLSSPILDDKMNGGEKDVNIYRRKILARGGEEEHRRRSEKYLIFE